MGLPCGARAGARRRHCEATSASGVHAVGMPKERVAWTDPAAVALLTAFVPANAEPAARPQIAGIAGDWRRGLEECVERSRASARIPLTLHAGYDVAATGNRVHARRRAKRDQGQRVSCRSRALDGARAHRRRPPRAGRNQCRDRGRACRCRLPGGRSRDRRRMPPKFSRAPS